VGDASGDLEQVVREEWGRLVALLLAQFRRLDLVEDALGDAVEAASRTWPADGVPANPPAWLMTAARRRVLDRLRTEDVARRKEPLLLLDAEQHQEGVRTMADAGSLVEDDVLRLVLMCAHPALAPEAASALSLRLVLGVPTADIARLFLVPEPTMAARITRAKKRIVGAGIPFAVPDAGVLPERLEVVAQTAYLTFTAGYSPGTGPDLLRADQSGEAIRLVRVVLGLRPDEPALVALLALMLLQHSRRDARVGEGRLVLLADQDRTRWHHDEIAEATRLLARPHLAGPLTPLAASYVLQARIAAEHATAPSAQETRWDRVVGLYDVLLRVAPTPSARLARAVAVAEQHGPVAGLDALEGLEVPQSHRPAAVRAELLSRAGDVDAARAAYDQAIAACRNEVETAFLVAQRDALPAR
jgi:RNA polymerase sigma-70 factor (ECF subfamily)